MHETSSYVVKTSEAWYQNKNVNQFFNKSLQAIHTRSDKLILVLKFLQSFWIAQYY